MEDNEKVEYKFGALPSPFDTRDYKLKKKVARSNIFPEEFELPMVRVKNQGQISSCVAHSISEVIEYFNAVQTGELEEMSTGYIYGNRRNSLHKLEGMYTRQALANAVKYGDVKKSLFHWNIEVPDAIELFEEHFDELQPAGLPYAITSYYRVKTIDEIKTALMNHGPVVMAITWYNDMKVRRDNGIMESSFLKSFRGSGHCMVIYGWNKDGWKVWNSWGKSWGINGTFVYPFKYPIDEAWGTIDQNITNSDVEAEIKKPLNNSIGNIIALILNFIINFFRGA